MKEGNEMKATATLKLNIDIDMAREMGIEIDDPKEYALEEMIEWIYEMTRTNDIAECIHIELEEANV
jgi:hypothetical protein